MANEYIKLFDTTSEYQAFTATTEYIKPNVSVCKDDLDNIHYSIEPRNISGAIVTCESATYNGETQIATNIIVRYNGRLLTNNTDYTITNNTGGINAGDYTFIINGIGKYKGSKQCTFTINKASRTMSWVTNPNEVYSGYSITIEAIASVGDGTITYSSSDTSKATVNGNVITGVDVGSSIITAAISESTNYLSADISYTLSIKTQPVVAKFNVTSTSSPTRIASATTGISSIEIDGVEQPSVETEYTFGTTGEHTIKYTLTDTTTISDKSFHSCSGMTSVIMPDSVTSIGNSAFTYCYKLTSCTIGSGVTSIGNNAFASTDLTSIVIPDSVTSIGNGAFYNCDNITTCTIGNGVTSISNSAFTYCYKLTTINIPSGVTSIGDNAFDSTDLTSINIPNSVTSIGESAFERCDRLTSIDIPSGVTSIGDSAFTYCYSLTSMTVDVNNSTFDSRNNCNAIIETTTNKLICGCKNTVIPNSVTSIGNAAFNGCSNLTSINIPDSVTSIGDEAFYDCNRLTSVTISDSVKTIGEMAFNACRGMKSCTIGSGVTSIGNNAFGNCHSLTSIDIPNSVTSIGQSTFYQCSGLTSCTIGSGVTSIGADAFTKCYKLTTINIPSGVTSIGNKAFYQCSGITSIAIPDSVITISDSAFTDCTSLTSCTIGSGATSIGNKAFSGCSAMTSCTIGNSVTTINESAFRGCSGLTSITIPDSVTTIGKSAFYMCYNLTTCTIGSGVTSVGDYAFDDTSEGLTSITVSSNNTTFDSRDNCNAIIETATNKLMWGCRNTVIPNTVTSINQYAFERCVNLTNITIPSSVTSIGRRAFGTCSNLVSITSNATTAPTIQSDTFQDVKTGGTLTVPQGSSGYNVWMGTGNYYLGKYNWTKVEQ